MLTNVRLWRFWRSAEVSKFRRVLLESICSNSGLVGCRIVLLKFPKYVGMPNGHEWMQDPLINEVVSIPVHVHQLYSIGNETRHSSQLVYSHQQCNIGVEEPRRGVKLCVVQSTMVHNDEAQFWLNGYVNKQNCRIWSEANPQVYVETPLHPEKLTVWFALWAGGILLQKR
ncbi:uncharacterized protein TNCV_1716521 [Trichonephila clavipes]|nr:uncharacterized protein TNCV_1716521 [Trichonephila clavipes]